MFYLSRTPALEDPDHGASLDFVVLGPGRVGLCGMALARWVAVEHPYIPSREGLRKAPSGLDSVMKCSGLRLHGGLSKCGDFQACAISTASLSCAASTGALYDEACYKEKPKL